MSSDRPPIAHPRRPLSDPGHRRAGRVSALRWATSAALLTWMAALAAGGCKEEPAVPPPPPPESSPAAPRPQSPIFSASGSEDPARIDVGALTPGFVRVAAGRFTMGSPGLEPGRSPDEVQHPVRISRPFEMQITEVTQAEYAALMGRNPADHKDCGESCPVEQVSWYEAAEYCNRLSARRGLPKCTVITQARVEWVGLGCKGFRLPTEAEWEFAARGGSEEAHYGPVQQVAWHDINAGMNPHPVASLKPNALGLYDMLGNVAEWTWDWMGEYPAAEVADPTGPAAGENKVFRGGAYRWPASESRHAFRNAYGPLNKVEFVGFRCVRTLQPNG